MNYKPIETFYAGHRFRSRLEARYAVLFDSLGIRWEYEGQGFEVVGRPYLPDFRLLDSGTWVEVKGAETELDQDLMYWAALHLPKAMPGFPTLLLLGPVPPPVSSGYKGWAWMGLGPEYDEDRLVSVHPAHWSLTPAGFPGHPLRRADTSSAPAFWEDDGWLTPCGDMATTVDVSHEHLELDAYVAARSARFEHGESG